ncbi:MAG: hypothetical protein H6708_04735 [Kofleriaceae bacterium]|nr:hypothetical protein [Myxococcales bacterium]MCB9559693.1 hypothetical protein [Kofleriaceae bacterium]
MFATPAGWSTTTRPKGLLLLPPGGAAVGMIHYAERRRPLASIDELIAAQGVPEGFVAAGEPVREAGASDEGELTELAVIRGALAGGDVQLGFGFVLLDDYYARATSIAYGARHHREVLDAHRRVLAGDVHLLGRLRRRWFRYARPPGWTETRDLFAATLTAPAPTSARIDVIAAIPNHDGTEAEVLGRMVPRHGGTSRPITTTAGLVGRLHESRAPDGAVQILAFVADACFAYVARYRGPRDGDGPAALDALIASVEPLAAYPGVVHARAAALFAHWAA